MKLRTNPKLLQEAIKRRNVLFEQAAAKKAIEVALKGRDVKTLEAAVGAAEKAALNPTTYPPLAQAKKLAVDLRDYAETVVRQKLTSIS